MVTENIFSKSVLQNYSGLAIKVQGIIQFIAYKSSKNGKFEKTKQTKPNLVNLLSICESINFDNLNH